MTSTRHDLDAMSADEGLHLDYRRWASDCERQALDPRISGAEREYLLTKKRALLMLAANEEWLGGWPARKGH